MDTLFLSLYGTLPRKDEERDVYVRKYRAYRRLMAKCQARGIKPSPKFIRKLTGKAYVRPVELPIKPYRDKELEALMSAVRELDNAESFSRFVDSDNGMREDS